MKKFTDKYEILLAIAAVSLITVAMLLAANW